MIVTKAIVSLHYGVLLALLFVFVGRATAEEESEFAAPVSYAQARLVKIFGAGIGRSPGYATGMIVSPEGDILTTQGVQLATTSLRVVLPNGETHFARVVRRSQNLQAALLKIEAQTPDFFDLAKPAELEPGDWVMAVSNAFRVADGPEPLGANIGVLQLRTQLHARRGVQDFPYEGEVLVIDAITSNPGAAGGAVVDIEGKLAGMIGKVIEGKNTNTRLNYAVPTRLLQEFVSQTTPEVVVPTVASTSAPGELGIRLFQLAGRRGPAFVDRVVSASPAAVAGVQSDDLLISLDGKAVKSGDEFARVIAAVKAGQEVTLVVKRKNELLTLRMTAVAK